MWKLAAQKAASDFMSGSIPALVLMLGAIIITVVLVRVALERVHIPSLIGYLVLGFLLRLSADTWGVLSKEAGSILEFFASLGIISLLFRVGLESKIAGLIAQLGRAYHIWLGNILISGLVGYLVAHLLLQLGVIPSIIVAIALTATSVGVSIGTWQETKSVDSPNGQLLVDVAELDDISGVILMALLFSVVSSSGGTEADWAFLMLATTGLFLLKIVGFGAFCALVSKHERSLGRLFYTRSGGLNRMLPVAGMGFIIAALAGLLGFSVALGAFFAGLVFSRDPDSVTIDASFGPLYELFSPFFFIGIGLSIDSSALTTALVPGALLIIAAFLGKLVGTTGPALITTDWRSSLLLGFSMVPRAEIAMVIMKTGSELGEWAVSSRVFAAMVLVSAMTCLISPLIVHPLLRRWPQTISIQGQS